MHMTRLISKPNRSNKGVVSIWLCNRNTNIIPTFNSPQNAQQQQHSDNDDSNNTATMMTTS